MVFAISSALPVPPNPVPATVGSAVLFAGRNEESLKVACASLFQTSLSNSSASRVKFFARVVVGVVVVPGDRDGVAKARVGHHLTAEGAHADLVRDHHRDAVVERRLAGAESRGSLLRSRSFGLTRLA